MQLFRTLDSLCRHIESPDIARYLAIDGEGRKVQLGTARRPIQGRVLADIVPVIAAVTNEMVAEPLLAARLGHFLRTIDLAAKDSEPFGELLERTSAAIGYVA